MSKIREALRSKYKNFIAMYLDKVCESNINGKMVSVVCFETMRYKVGWNWNTQSAPNSRN